jgi:hypothetical protein
MDKIPQHDSHTHTLFTEDLDHASSLERAAHITLCLVEDLQSATATVTSLTKMMPSSTKNSNNTDGSNSNNNNANNNSNSSNHLPSMRTPLAQDSERAQFVLKLAPRIRRLESDTIISLGQRMERILKDLQHYRQEHQNQQGAATTNDNADATNDNGNNNSTAAAVSTTAAADGTASQEDLLLMLGHCMRGLALLGRGKEVESIFARVAIMPLIRSKVSMGRLDEGGSRGECAGLFSLLDDMAFSVHAAFGPVLSLAESMFDVGGVRMDVDLLTCGVWVPIATALMADAGIKMAIFSPGIASILQANYTALDVFLSELSARLLTSESTPQSLPPLSDMNGANNSNNNHGSDLYFRPSISKERIQQAQDRIYSHPKTAEFSKKWNLPIYYQLRFGECCTRLNQAVDKTQREGWVGDVFSRSSEEADSLKQKYGFELSLFLELYDVLLGLWRPDVILRPLTNRFLRGSVQLIGRVVAFIDEGMDGKTKFGEEPQILNGTAGNGTEADGSQQPAYPTRTTYCWGDSEIDVAAVAWELTILESNVRHDYVNTVCDAFCNADSSESEREELRSLISETLKDASDQIHPLIDKAWNEYIVNILTTKCAGPLAGVRGVAATYRMTNRPPPTQASPFVGSILRPLKEFDQEFSNRTPDRVGSRWKQQIVVAIADRYAAAVEELIATVQRTEAALQSRRTRRTSAGGMSDGEKVKLQLYLDCLTFSQSVLEVGVDPATVIGLSKLRDLTAEGEQLRQNGK